MQVLPYILNFSRQFPEEVLISAFINIRHFPRREAVKFVASGIKWRKISGNEVTSLGVYETVVVVLWRHFVVVAKSQRHLQYFRYIMHCAVHFFMFAFVRYDIMTLRN